MTMLHTMRRLALGLGVSALVAVSSGVHAAGAPKKGGTLRYGTVSEIVSLDPHVYGGNAWKVLIEALYSPLVGYDKTGAVVPRLAQSWEQPDARSIVFHLRAGAKFHDGTPVTADDVKFSLDRILDPAAGATLREANGWQREAGGVGVYGNAYMRRALAAQAQPGASLPADLPTLLLAADSRGEAVDGSRRYHLRFASGQLPPAGAFWSLAAYDAQGLLAPNALNRQALGSRDPLRYNEDGSLDLVLGHEAPAPEQQSNWLPLPASGPAQLLLRVYQPGPALLDGLWTPPPLLAETPPEVTAEAAPAPAAPATDPDPETGASAPAASATTATSSVPATPPAKPAVQGKAKPQAQSQPGR